MEKVYWAMLNATLDRLPQTTRKESI